MRARKKGDEYSPYYPAPNVMTNEALWAECVKAVKSRFKGLELNERDEDLKDEAYGHAMLFYPIHRHDLDKTLAAVEVFVARYILDHKKRFGERLYDMAIGIMAEEQTDGK
jgi:hypothetical protein